MAMGLINKIEFWLTGEVDAKTLWDRLQRGDLADAPLEEVAHVMGWTLERTREAMSVIERAVSHARGE